MGQQNADMVAAEGATPSRSLIVKKNRRKNWAARLFLAFFALTYALLFLDVWVEHHIGLVPATPGKLVPLVFSALAAGISVLAMLRPRKEIYYLFAIATGFSIIVGVAGTYFHLSSQLEDISFKILHFLPPKLAPLSFSGIGVFGLFTAFMFLRGESPGEQVRDPVCGRSFAKAMAYAKLRDDGNVYYMCCPLCEQEFRTRQSVAQEKLR